MGYNTQKEGSYAAEEIVPIVAELARRYTGMDSSSITYERAQQLMQAVLYCIKEWHREGVSQALMSQTMTAREAYEAGYELVMQKTKRALALYHEILSDFDAYENRCLKDTIVKGMPAFFKWYDVTYNPMDTILTLDYPVLTDLSAYEGVDRIYEYLKCIYKEQQLLGRLERREVIQRLSDYNPGYRSMIDNLWEAVRRSGD